MIPQGPTIPADSSATYSKSSGAVAVKSLILPTYSTEVDALTVQIPNPVAGMLVFNSFTGKLNFFDGSTWEVVTSA
jgi:hypothetical protein